MTRAEYVKGVLEWFRREGAFFECSDAVTAAAWHLPGGGYFLLSTIEECETFDRVRDVVMGVTA